MAPRLGHKKSRNGCVSCKRRRVKCDEKKPCGACVRYGWQCSLTTGAAGQSRHSKTPPARHTKSKSPGVTHASSDSQGQRHLPDSLRAAANSASPIVSDTSSFLAPTPNNNVSTTSSLPSPGPFSPRSKELPAQSNQWLQDLELLHHWSTNAYKSFQMPKYQPGLWQIAVPSVALQHAYLMHALLAVTSLHLAHLMPADRRRYSLISTSHQNSALAGFSTALPNVTRENADAVFLGSIFVSLFAFANSAQKGMDPDESFTLVDVVELLALVRGIEQTLSAGNTRKWVQQGKVSSLLRVPYRPDLDMNSSAFIFRPYLGEFRELLVKSQGDYSASTIESILHALAELDRTYKLLLSDEPVLNSGYVMSWPTCVSMDYLSLVQEGNPLALILLAIFCAMLYFHEDRWMWHGWAARVMDLITVALDPQWHSWLKWPKELIESGAKFEEVSKTGTPASNDGSRSMSMAASSR